MDTTWIIFSYSLPSKNKSSARVALWRRLQRLGTISPTGGVFILPAFPQTIESFQWLTQEVQHADGQAMFFHSDHIEGFSQQALVNFFCEARQADYAPLAEELANIQKAISKSESENDPKTLVGWQDSLHKLKRRHQEIAGIDYFNCPEGRAVSATIATLARQISGEDEVAVEIMPASIADYQQKTWVTRPQPHVDRLASIWLIQRYIDPTATIRFDTAPQDGEISFDMPNATFGHTGHLCTFETLCHTFQIKDTGLVALTELIHEIDLGEGRYIVPEMVGVDAVLQGWLQQGLSDEELMQRGLFLFDGLLANFAPE